MFGPNKQSSSFVQSQQPLKRCKSNASQQVLPSKAKEIETTNKSKKTFNKQKTNIPMPVKGIAKAVEAEAEQLQVFVDEDLDEANT